jgi:hypothetical protein
MVAKQPGRSCQRKWLAELRQYLTRSWGLRFLTKADRQIFVRSAANWTHATWSKGAFAKEDAPFASMRNSWMPASGVQLWAETYNRELGEGGPFETLDDVTDRIVATVASGHGVIARSMATATRGKPLEEASASQLVSRWFTYVLQLKAEEHARLRAAFERVLDREPNHADAWACLSNLCCWEYQAGRLLGLTSRFEFEDFLKNRSIYDQACSVEDLAEDLENLRKLRRASSDEDRWRT